MALQTAQQKMLNKQMMEEQVKQIALNHFYAYYVRHDMEDMLANVDAEVQ